jgi:hypothetical protein
MAQIIDFNGCTTLEIMQGQNCMMEYLSKSQRLRANWPQGSLLSSKNFQWREQTLSFVVLEKSSRMFPALNSPHCDLREEWAAFL